MLELPAKVMNAWEAKKSLFKEIDTSPKMLAQRGGEVQALQGIAEKLQVQGSDRVWITSNLVQG